MKYLSNTRVQRPCPEELAMIRGTTDMTEVLDTSKVCNTIVAKDMLLHSGESRARQLHGKKRERGDRPRQLWCPGEVERQGKG